MLTPHRAWRGTPVRAGQPIDRIEDAQGRAHGTLWVVLVHDRHTEDTDHGVADELLDDAPVGLDGAGRAGRVLTGKSVDVLGVCSLTHRREGDQVAEEGSDGLALFGNGRRGESGEAHWPQNLNLSGLSAPQAGQTITTNLPRPR